MMANTGFLVTISMFSQRCVYLPLTCQVVGKMSISTPCSEPPVQISFAYRANQGDGSFFDHVKSPFDIYIDRDDDYEPLNAHYSCYFACVTSASVGQISEAQNLHRAQGRIGDTSVSQERHAKLPASALLFLRAV